jgi:Ca2+-binding RTX toxin-like protein
MAVTGSTVAKLNPANLTYFRPTGDPAPSDYSDLLYGTDGADTIHGMAGWDTIYGGKGNDRLYGDEGKDTLFGGEGNDILDGGFDNDTLDGGAGADTLIGGAGDDTASYEHAKRGVTLSLATGGVSNDAEGDTYSGIENVTGSAYNDIIAGNSADNFIFGMAGDDFVFGMAGNDDLFGASGNDIVRGGVGDDYLSGGDGNDRLTGDDAGSIGNDIFDLGARDSGVDTVTDFQRGHDKLDFAGLDANSFGTDGRLAVGSVSHGFSNLDGDSFAFDVKTHKLYMVDTFINGSTGQETLYLTEIAILQDVTTLTTDDFLI